MSKKRGKVKRGDTTTWLPRADRTATLESAFMTRCRGLEVLISARTSVERELNIDNFDSGPGVEDIVRSALRELLPSRYAVGAGVVSDSNGYTAGDCDIVVFNEWWFPHVKAGAALHSRRMHYPVEGVYAVIEVKQTLVRRIGGVSAVPERVKLNET